jgi:hypothetical protein
VREQRSYFALRCVVVVSINSRSSRPRTWVRMTDSVPPHQTGVAVASNTPSPWFDEQNGMQFDRQRKPPPALVARIEVADRRLRGSSEALIAPTTITTYRESRSGEVERFGE